MRVLVFFVALFPSSIFAIHSHMNNIPVRVQWEENSGYCGEASFISAGLYYGQYISQYDARLISSKRGNQQEELLLGINDRRAAKKMHLNADFWPSNKGLNSHDFLAWVKQNSYQGYPVIIGVYENQWLFEGDSNPDAGDSEYDHIVVVNGFRSHHSLSNPHYSGDDKILFLDNGLWSAQTDHQFEYSFDSFLKTRKASNEKNGPVYSLANTLLSKKVANYGVAIIGVKDLDGDTLPVRIDTNINYESPEIIDGSDKRPAPSSLILTITVSELQPNVPYILYRYSDLDLVPDSHFNASSKNASESWNIEITHGSTYSMTQTIQSNEIAVYRAVKASAP